MPAVWVDRRSQRLAIHLRLLDSRGSWLTLRLRQAECPPPARGECAKLRVSNEDRALVHAGTIDGARAVVREGQPGCYHVDEISSDPLPSGHASRRWGVGIKRRDGFVTIDRNPRPAKPDGRAPS